jgi:transcriptional regulator with GAF, ATPase, and Fis domain
MTRSHVLLGGSAAMSNLREEVACAAKSDVRVLLSGESGVGKEVVAHLIHDQGTRSTKTMLAVNCAGLTDSLLESEMFGHVRGSFTDAYRDKRGLLELADGGTLFMDEVGEMSLRLQALLLRFLENGELQPVGSDRLKPVSVDVRVITATNRDLVDRCSRREFRSDLYYRLNVIHIQIAPLRERREDIPLLLAHFLAHYARGHRVAAPELSREALAVLVGYDWPGNVRELMNVVEQLTVRHPGRVVTPLDLPHEVGAVRRVDAASPVRPVNEANVLFERIVRGGESFWSVVYDPFMVRDLTREHVRQVIKLGLQQTRGSYKALVPLLGMLPSDYKRFLNFLRKHQCQLPFQTWRAMPVAAALPASSVNTRDEGLAVGARRTSHWH